MKRGATPTTNSERNVKQKISDNTETSLINDTLPEEMFQEILSHFDFDLHALTTFSRVSKSWHSHATTFCRQLIDKYFPYLQSHEEYSNNSIYLVYKEIKYYENLCPAIETRFILAALQGDKITVESYPTKNHSEILYAILLANGHKIPEKEEENKGLATRKYIPKALTIAAGNGKLELVEKFLANGDNTHSFFMAVKDALYRAAMRGHIEVVNLLLKYRHIAAYDIISIICRVAEAGQLGMLKNLLKYKTNGINYVIEEALSRAASKGHLQVVQYLIDTYNFDADKVINAFIAAAFTNHIEVAQFLHSTVCNKNGNLYREHCQNFLSTNIICRALIIISKKVDVFESLSALEQPYVVLKASIEEDNLEIMQFLLNRTQLDDKKRQALLEIAIRHDRIVCLKYLLTHMNISIKSYRLSATGIRSYPDFIINKGKNTQHRDFSFDFYSNRLRMVNYPESYSLLQMAAKSSAKKVVDYLLTNSNGNWEDNDREKAMRLTFSSDIRAAIQKSIDSDVTIIQTFTNGIYNAFRWISQQAGITSNSQPNNEDAMDIDEPAAPTAATVRRI